MTPATKPAAKKDLIEWDSYDLGMTKRAIRSIDHALRKKIINIIAERKEVTITDLYVILRMEQSVCSQHAGILRRAGVVDCRREGKFIYYSLNYARIAQIQKGMKGFEPEL